MAATKKLYVGKGGGTPAGYSSIAPAIRCEKEYQLGKVRGIKVPVKETPLPFAVGGAFHAGRAAWFVSGFKTDTKTEAKVVEAVKEYCRNEKLPVSLGAERQGLDLIAAYMAHWCKRPAPVVKAVEWTVGPAPLKPDDPFFLYRTAGLDDVSVYADALGKQCIGEAKTTSDSIADAVNEYTLHGQPLMQHLVYRMSENGQKLLGPVDGTMLDVVVKPGRSGKTPTFGRVFVPVTEWSLQWYVQSMDPLLRRLATMTESSFVERRITQCTRVIAGRRFACEFRDLCHYGSSASSKYMGRDGKSLQTITYENGKRPWD